MTTQHDERAELTPEQLADLVPLGAVVMEDKNKKLRGIMFTFPQLREFAAALLAADSRADGEVVKRGFVQVPFRMNQAMRDVTDSEGWTWEDLLGAAEAITEEQYDELAADPAPAEPEPLTEFDVRGMLASRLSCWHRLSLQEAYELVEIFSAHHIGKPKDVGINGLTEAETAASASVMGLTGKSQEISP